MKLKEESNGHSRRGVLEDILAGIEVRRCTPTRTQSHVIMGLEHEMPAHDCPIQDSCYAD